MTPRESVALTGYIQAHFPSTPINDFTPDALAEVLEPYPLVDCRAAVLAHVGRSAWCAPADVVTGVRQIRNKRIALVGDLCPPPNLTDAQERAWLGSERRAIADGEEPTDPYAGLVATRSAEDVRELIAAATTTDEGTDMSTEDQRKVSS